MTTMTINKSILPQWDVPGIFAAFGTLDDLMEAIAGSGHVPPDRSAVWQWRMRGRIPSWWMPLILALLTGRGHGTATRFIISVSAPLTPAPNPRPRAAAGRAP